MKSLMQQNKEHVHRWRSLRIIIPPDSECETAESVLNEMTGDLENIVELFIMGNPDNGMSESRCASRRLTYFRNLRHLTTIKM